MPGTEEMRQQARERAGGNTRLGAAGVGQPPSFTARARRLTPILVCLAIFSNARFFLPHTSGASSYLLAGLMLLAPILAMKEVGSLLASSLGLRLRLGGLTNLALAAGAATAALLLIEVFLQLAARLPGSADRLAFSTTLVMPAHWEKRPAQIPGAQYAYYWHDILHVHNRDGMRLAGDFPPKRPGTFRILALGDSLTYGYGVAEEDTYPSVLEAELRKAFRVEVLNLGVSGAQSEDVLRILQRQLPRLNPDLVFYGTCVNDFLPSGVGQYASNRAYAVPLPYKTHFVTRTLTGRFLEKQYDNVLMQLGLRVDFLTDILRDFEGYQARFARDAHEMNTFVLGRGLPPMVAMVLDQYPNTRGRKNEVVLAAERHLRAAGIRVIPSDYIQRHDGARDWHVSPWEGHPNEKADRAFAEEILKVLRDLPELQPYRRQAHRPAPLGARFGERRWAA